MNQLGVHALVRTGGWSESEAALAIAETKRAGYDLIEIPLLDPASVDAAMTRRLLEKHGLTATCSLGLAAATDISSEDPDAVAAREALLRSALKCATWAASPVQCVPKSTCSRRRPPAGRMRSPSSNAWHSEAAANGVTLGLEVVNRYETNLAVEHPRRVAYLRKRLTTNTVSTATRAIRVYPGILRDVLS